MQEALSIVKKDTLGFGISIDLDAFDPTQVPAVSTPEANGFSVQEVRQALSQLARDPQLLGFEIAEFNPARDDNHRTEIVIGDLIAALTLGAYA